MSTFYDRGLVKWSTIVGIGIGVVGLVLVIVGSGPVVDGGASLMAIGVFSALAGGAGVLVDRSARRRAPSDESSKSYYAGPEQAGWGPDRR